MFSCSRNTGLIFCYSLKTSDNHSPHAHKNYSITHFNRKMSKNKVAKNKVTKNAILSGQYRDKGF